MTPVPETRYAKSGDVHIAYQVLGEGPIDLVFVPGFVSNVEATWAQPGRAAFFRRLASFSRLILFDKRGTGMSDRTSQNFTLEQRMEDVHVVMDAAGSKRAALFGISEGGPMSILFAASYPQRTSALALYGAYAKRSWAEDHPFGWPEEKWAAVLQGWSATGERLRASISSCGRHRSSTTQSAPRSPRRTSGPPPAPARRWRS
jgi:pimeloyl-ACP methyl ester carboxylesterase